MATVIPVTGSFIEYAERFIDDCLAFALGWAYWWLWVTVSLIVPNYLDISKSWDKADQFFMKGPGK